jgi:hypothetical protein
MSLDHKEAGQTSQNFWLGVSNGVFMKGAGAFFHPTLVLAPFLATLGAPATVVGLMPAMMFAGWFLPQLFVASRIGHQPRKIFWYRYMTVIRVFSYVLMVAVVFGFPGSSALMVVTVVLGIGIVSLANGITGIPFADIVAKVVPHYRLGTFWVLRNAIGGALGLGSGFLLRNLLGGDISFPRNFAIVFLIGTVLSTVAYLSFSLVREPLGLAGQKQPFRRVISRIPDLLRNDRNFLQYLRVRFLARLALAADPFFAIYALKYLGAPASSLGLFVIVATSSAIVANLMFRAPANQGKNVLVFQVAIAFLIAAPVAALLLPSWQAFLLVFLCSAVGQAGLNIASWNLLYVVSPAEERSLYVGTANSLLSLPALAPIAAGVIVDLLGFGPVFVVAGVFGGAALVFALRSRGLVVLDKNALNQS